MFCQNCGKQLFGSTATCPYCNAPVNNNVDPNYNPNQNVNTGSTETANSTNSYVLNGVTYGNNNQAQSHQNYQTQYQASYQPQNTPFMPGQNQGTTYNGYNNIKEVESAKTMGIVSVVLAVLGVSIIGLIVGIIGMGKVKPIYFANSIDANARSAYNWNKAGMVANIIRLVFTVIIVIAYIMLISSTIMDETPDLSYNMFINWLF